MKNMQRKSERAFAAERETSRVTRRNVEGKVPGVKVVKGDGVRPQNKAPLSQWDNLFGPILAIQNKNRVIENPS